MPVKGFSYTISDQSAVFGKNVNSVFSQLLPDTMSVTVGEEITLACETINETHTVRWFQNGREVTNSKRIKCTSEGLL